MRNALLASTAVAFALAMGAPAIASGTAASDDVRTAQADTGTTGAQPETGTDTGAGTTGAGTGASEVGVDEPQYRSYTASPDFQGTLAGGFSADELIGADVVGVDGETIGTVSDILIGPDQQANRVLVDAGGFLGIGTKSVALELDRLHMQDGDLVTDLTEAEIEAMPSYTQEGDDWMRDDTPTRAN